MARCGKYMSIIPALRRQAGRDHEVSGKPELLTESPSQDMKQPTKKKENLLGTTTMCINRSKSHFSSWGEGIDSALPNQQNI